MMKIIIYCFFLTITFCSFSQNIDQQIFTIHRYGDSVRIESCIPFNLYNTRVEIPSFSSERKVMAEIPIHVIGSKWVNECLIIHWPNLSNDEIVSYIKEFTILREDQIILSE
jgi:hypothetical protein